MDTTTVTTSSAFLPPAAGEPPTRFRCTVAGCRSVVQAAARFPSGRVAALAVEHGWRRAGNVMVCPPHAAARGATHPGTGPV